MSEKMCPILTLLSAEASGYIACQDDCKWLDARGNCAVEALHVIYASLTRMADALEALERR